MLFEGQRTTVFLLGKPTEMKQRNNQNEITNIPWSSFKMEDLGTLGLNLNAARLPCRSFECKTYRMRMRISGLRLSSRSISLQILDGVSHSNSVESMCLTQFAARVPECGCIPVELLHTSYRQEKSQHTVLCRLLQLSCFGLQHQFLSGSDKREFLWEALNWALNLLQSRCWLIFFLLFATLKE